MKASRLKGAALAAAMLMGAMPAHADLTFPMLSYRTGPYGPNGTEFADGYADYFTLLNERDGGIGGVKVVVDVAAAGGLMTDIVHAIDAPLSRGLNLYPADMVSFERRHVFSLTKGGGL